MTPQDLITKLEGAGADAPLIFVTKNGPINAGYHVTEVKLASVQSLDCGARRSSWSEVVIQLLDGSGQDFMTVGKFTGILKKATSKLEGLDEAALKFEFSNDNQGLRILEPRHPVAAEDGVSLPLGDINAACKPMVEAAHMRDSARCRGSSPQAGHACC